MSAIRTLLLLYYPFQKVVAINCNSTNMDATGVKFRILIWGLVLGVELPAIG